MIIRRKVIDPIDFHGLKILDYAADQDTSSSLAVITIPPGGRHPEAWSKRSDKYYYVISSTVSFTLDGKKHPLASGDCCIVLQGQHFSYENTTQETAELLLIHTPGFEMESEVFVQ